MAFDAERYHSMIYRRSGRSGLLLPAVSLGLWHNFGGKADHATCRSMLTTAFDLGVTHFDLANNYGPPPGSAEERFGTILREDFASHRDEMIISTKAGYRMWPGPYGEWGSRKYLIASLDQSLQRMGLDYVDIFYSHRPDPNTPLEETLGALDTAVQQGKALYAGVSSYGGGFLVEAAETATRRAYAPITIHQPLYNMLTRRFYEHDVLPYLGKYGMGSIVYCPLAQGLLTDKYLDHANPVPPDSRAADPDGALRKDMLTAETLEKVRALNDLAQGRGQSLAQMAVAWCLRWPDLTSVLVGARTPEQVKDCVGALSNLDFADEELARIDELCPLG